MCVCVCGYVRSEVIVQALGLGKKGPDEMCPALMLLMVVVCLPLVGGGGGGGVGDGVSVCVCVYELSEGLRSKGGGVRGTRGA